MNKVILGYWQIRGLGQVPRLLLAYSGANWEDHKYYEHQRDRWFKKDKLELGMDFPNLPYIIDGDFKLTESKAVAEYIIRKYDKNQLLGKNIKDEATIKQIIGVLDDMDQVFLVCWEDDWKEQLPKILQKNQMKSKYLNDFYGQKDFALGYLSLADFYATQLSFYVQKLLPQLYQKHSFWKRCRKSFQSLPKIEAYYQNESSVKGPFTETYTPVQI